MDIITNINLCEDSNYSLRWTEDGMVVLHEDDNRVVAVTTQTDIKQQTGNGKAVHAGTQYVATLLEGLSVRPVYGRTVELEAGTQIVAGHPWNLCGAVAQVSTGQHRMGRALADSEEVTCSRCLKKMAS